MYFHPTERLLSSISFSLTFRQLDEHLQSANCVAATDVFQIRRPCSMMRFEHWKLERSEINFMPPHKLSLTASENFSGPELNPKVISW